MGSRLSCQEKNIPVHFAQCSLSARQLEAEYLKIRFSPTRALFELLHGVSRKNCQIWEATLSEKVCQEQEGTESVMAVRHIEERGLAAIFRGT